MTTENAAVVAAPETVSLQDMSVAQLSERMAKLAERHDVLKTSVAEFETVTTELKSVSEEFQKRLGVNQAVATKKDAKAPRARKESDQKYPSLKEVVLGILGKSPDGLELKGIVTEVQGMITRKEYDSSAKSLSAVVSQAVNALKAENLINHDRENKKYKRAETAA